MQNIFVEQPEFLERDPRKNRPNWKGGSYYAVTPEFMHMRHQILLAPHLIKGKKVLDLGSCNAASGAWALSNGASFYRGVELQAEFVASSQECLAQYYPANQWDICQASLEDYLATNTEQFDVILAAGVLYGVVDALGILSLMTARADCIVIESAHIGGVFRSPYLSPATKKVLGQDPNIIAFLENDSQINVFPSGMNTVGDQTVRFNGMNPSMGALKFIFAALGYRYHDGMNLALKRQLPDIYSPIHRFGMLLTRDPDMAKRDFGFTNVMNDPSNAIVYDDWSKIGQQLGN